MDQGNINKKVYSRKELTQWIDRDSHIVIKNFNLPIAIKINIDSLKNGLFFLYVLSNVFNDDYLNIKQKINFKPVTDYDFDKNLQLMKRILNKNNLQINLNTHDIIKAKNNFDLLNWFKNLNDGTIGTKFNPGNTQSQYYKTCGTGFGFKPLQTYHSPVKDFQSQSHLGSLTKRQPSGSKKMLSHSKSGGRTYSAAKSQHPCPKGKTETSNRKDGPLIPQPDRRSQAPTHKRGGQRLASQLCMSDFDSLDDCNQALYEMALQESIDSFKIILEKIKKAAENDNVNLEQYLDQVQKAIYEKNVV